MAGAIITLFLTSLFALNSNMVHLLRAAAEAANASQDLQTRVEQVRLANWNQITDPAWLGSSTNFFHQTDQTLNLPGMSEVLTVTPYSSVMLTTTGAAAFTVTHNADGTITSSPASLTANALSALQGNEMIRLDLQISWPSLHRRRQRSLTTVISQWGISK